MGQIVDSPPRPGGRSSASTASKPFSIFISNLLKQRAITQQMAQTLHRLPNPPLQFEAMMRLRRQPAKSLETIVQEMLAPLPEPPRDWQDQRAARNPPHNFNRRGVFTAILVGSAAVLSVYFLRGRVAVIPPPLLRATASPPAQRIAALNPPLRLAPAPQPVSSLPFARPVQKPVKPAPRVVAPPPSIAIGHLSAQWQPHGMVHLSWDAGEPGSRFRLYAAPSPDFRVGRILQQDLIPMNWWDWMPPEGPVTVWLAVSQILPSGEETPVSQPVEIRVP